MRALHQRQASDESTDGPTRRRLLKGAFGVATTTAAIPVLSGEATAHFPIELDVDIQPENAANFIDLEAHDTVAVAVHTSTFLNSDGNRTTFDPTTRPTPYRFGSRFAVQNGDGARPTGDGEVTQLDGEEALVLDFPVTDTGLDGGEETAWLYWERDESGTHGFSGVDSVRVYSPDDATRDLLEWVRRLLGDHADG